MTEKWSQIIEAYKKAEKFSFGRDREKGRMYLYKAYHDAVKQAEKEHLWYAKILFMMYEDYRGKYGEMALFRCFLEKAYEEYLLAKAENEELMTDEGEPIGFAYKRSKEYVDMLSRRNDPHALDGIIGLPEDIDLRGSRIVHFRHDTDSAEMELECGGRTVSLRFTDVYEIKAELLPAVNCVSEIVCRKCPDSGVTVFDAGIYRILCGGVEVVYIRKY